MQYVSTRGNAPQLDFTEVLLTGLAADGGLYVPEYWPQFSYNEIRDMRDLSYAAVAEQIIAKFVGEYADLSDLISDAYAGFGDQTAPLIQVSDRHVLELFHGPTQAFKDFAMQLLSRLMQRSISGRTTVLAATSGDTGAAAVAAFKNIDNVELFVLFPRDRVTAVQRRQMTVCGGANTHALCIDGTFDDCQALVKGMFNNAEFRSAVNLAGVNSVNWARITAQIIYYFTAAVALGAPDVEVNFAVPTGNFGDAYAGFVAKQMGLPINKIVAAVNANSSLHAAFNTGKFERRDVVKTLAPAMDIQISSNFERLLFEAVNRDAVAVADMMRNFKEYGEFAIPAEAREKIAADFVSESVGDDEIKSMICEIYAVTGYLLDPHTAVGFRAAEQISEPTVVVATASPNKSPNEMGSMGFIVQKVAGLAGEEKYEKLTNNQARIEEHIRTVLGS